MQVHPIVQSVSENGTVVSIINFSEEFRVKVREFARKHNECYPNDMDGLADRGVTIFEKIITKREDELRTFVQEIEYLSKTKTPRCQNCHADFVKINKHTWKPNCLCFKTDLRLCVG